jgi:large subunit GTPase 1
LKIISTDSSTNPYVLTPQQESALESKQASKKSALTVPRRPPWSPSTTPSALERAEKDSFLEWRRGLAQLQESDDLLLTPFERNLEVWRQLWRVIERSDLVVQIVDARNPLLFRTEDLERYVREVDAEKRNLLLINKADLMTEEQRRKWAEWFGERGIRFAFYSARLAKEAMDALKEEEDSEEEDLEDVEEEGVEELAEDLDDLDIDIRSDSPDHEDDPEPEEDGDGDEDPRTRILTVHELQSLFLREAPTPKGHDPLHPTKLVVGLVGYPNVGKSSTINSLLGEKRVSVSSTPGKTKHFQTIHLPPPSDDDVPAVILCDCPGLVFPNFASTKADLVCNGILPIDQLREWTGPASLLTRRIPKEVFEQVYTFKVYSKDETNVTGEELLISFASNPSPPISSLLVDGSLICFSGPRVQKSGTSRKP